MGIGQRADQRDGRVLAQWQRLLTVLQQDQRVARHLPCRLAMQADFGIDLDGIVRRLADTPMRIMEQAEVVLGTEHTPHGLVDQLDRHLTALDQPRQFLQIKRVMHAQIDTRLDRQARSLAPVAGHAVAQQFVDGAVVADVQPTEAPVVAQQVAQQPAVGAGRHAVDGVQRDHHAACAGVHRGTVWR